MKTLIYLTSFENCSLISKHNFEGQETWFSSYDKQIFNKLLNTVIFLFFYEKYEKYKSTSNKF